MADVSGAPVAADVATIPVAAGAGWSLTDFACGSGPDNTPFEERHEGMTIALVRQGSFTYHADTGSALLHPGAILLGNTGTCYCCSHGHGIGDVCRSLKLSSALFAEISATHAGSGRFCWPVPMLPARIEYQPSGAVTAPGNAQAHMGLELAMLGYVAALLRQVSGTPASAQRILPRDERRIGRVLRHMEERATEPIDLDILADIAAMSKFHFIRVFRSVTGLTPYNYLIGLRLTAAATALRQTDTAVSTIALDAGFDDLSTFIAAFGIRFGCPPGAYRRRYGRA